MLYFLVWYGSLSHCLFCKWTRISKQNHMCAKVIHLLDRNFGGKKNVHTQKKTYQTFLVPNRDHLFSRVSVRLFDAHPSSIAVFTPAPKKRTKEENESEFFSTELNKAGVNTPLIYAVLFQMNWQCEHKVNWVPFLLAHFLVHFKRTEFGSFKENYMWKHPSPGRPSTEPQSQSSSNMLVQRRKKEQEIILSLTAGNLLY